ncbi:carbohydrate ABC transporter permease [Cohnella hongkongensis]|uniref:Carbohydrate ABC transporter permease n=1 Tax=Cohnella hongkongensis TaxID=178337 RepID=A0ABV9FAW5_9BACL
MLSIVGYLVIGAIAVACLLPFLLIISGSITSEEEITRDGFSFFPESYSLESYRIALKVPEQIIRAYAVTSSLTVVGTVIGTFLSAMAAYVLQRQDFSWRNGFSFYIYFTVLFNGGLVPWYILMVNYLNLKDHYLALLLPPLLNVFFIIVMKSFLRSIPDAITESAKIDGAGDFTIFLRLILPLSKPALATIGLFTAMNYWNDWYNAMLFVNNQDLYSLQYYLYRMLANIDQIKTLMAKSGMALQVLPSEGLKMALTVIVTGPVMLLYPFVQRFFIQGLTVGAVKG